MLKIKPDAIEWTDGWGQKHKSPALVIFRRGAEWFAVIEDHAGDMWLINVQTDDTEAL